jgi:transcription initiation factor TFIIIB Brf1 subunit/transcription initiation factor TFIIB
MDGCRECKATSDRLYEDPRSGDLVCMECGLVCQEKSFMTDVYGNKPAEDGDIDEQEPQMSENLKDMITFISVSEVQRDRTLKQYTLQFQKMNKSMKPLMKPTMKPTMKPLMKPTMKPTMKQKENVAAIMYSSQMQIGVLEDFGSICDSLNVKRSRVNKILSESKMINRSDEMQRTKVQNLLMSYAKQLKVKPTKNTLYLIDKSLNLQKSSKMHVCMVLAYEDSDRISELTKISKLQKRQIEMATEELKIYVKENDCIK